MMTQSMITVNQQMWDEALKSILSLSKATIKHNMELEVRVADLEMELWYGSALTLSGLRRPSVILCTSPLSINKSRIRRIQRGTGTHSSFVSLTDRRYSSIKHFLCKDLWVDRMLPNS
ncbi:hypothetical protein F5051DRAFT_230909 [Lentinula edodes]|nr:hypothetical protein F5051DRAFT_230909 [Lentinula edodes]